MSTKVDVIKDLQGRTNCDLREALNLFKAVLNPVLSDGKETVAHLRYHMPEGSLENLLHALLAHKREEIVARAEQYRRDVAFEEDLLARKRERLATEEMALRNIDNLAVELEIGRLA